MTLPHLRRLAFASTLLLLNPPPLRADLASAQAALQAGRAGDAKTLLTQVLASAAPEASIAKAHQLLCRLYYAEDMSDPAIAECSLAARQHAATPAEESQDQMWLGRSYGMKASHANPMSAYRLAKPVRLAFERAVVLDPHNIRAASDLGEFYVDAPSMLGGGLDKAEALARAILPDSPAAAHRLLALAAQSRSDLSKAETEFKAAVAAEHTPETYVDLAHFYEKHDRPEDAVAQVEAASAADRKRGPALVDAASILTAAKRRPELAIGLLRDYLGSGALSEAAPAFRVHLQLGRLLQKQDDTPGAQKEFAAALSLAPDYPPAQKAAHPAWRLNLGPYTSSVTPQPPAAGAFTRA